VSPCVMKDPVLVLPVLVLLVGLPHASTARQIQVSGMSGMSGIGGSHVHQKYQGSGGWGSVGFGNIRIRVFEIESIYYYKGCSQFYVR